MTINFPTSPSVGDTYTFVNRSWVWNGTGWTGGGPSGAGDWYGSPYSFLNPRYGLTGSGDHTQAMQDCIDDMYANHPKGGQILMPRRLGGYNITNSLYFDPPTSTRLHGLGSTSNAATYSIEFVAEGGCMPGAIAADESQITTTFIDRPALVFGPSVGTIVRNVGLRCGVAANHPKLRGAACTGFYITGGPGGSVTRIENCRANRFYNGFAVGLDISSLGDSNTFIKCMADSNYIAYNINASQNFITSFYDCQAAYNSIGLQATPMCNVYGGNWSVPSAAGVGFSGTFSISAVSALSAFTDFVQGPNSFTNYSFTAVIASPNSNWTDLIYNSCAIPTSKFGLVPVVLDSYNSGTSTATFKLWRFWAGEYKANGYDMSTGTDLAAELAAATTVYAAERVTTFKGGVRAHGCHVENSCVTTLLENREDSTTHSILENFLINENPSLKEIAGTSLDARYKVQQCFPWIIHETGHLTLRHFDGGETYPVVYDAGEPNELHVEDLAIIFNQRISCGKDYTVDALGGLWATRAFGTGYFSRSPYGGSGNYAFTSLTKGYWTCPMIGSRPAPWVTPTMLAADVAVLTAAIADFNHRPPCGGVNYSVPDGTNYSFVRFTSPDYGYSWGKTLTIDWNCKGQSYTVNVSGTDVAKLFVGLKITLVTSVTGTYIIKRTWPLLGVIEVQRTGEHSGSGAIQGTKTVTYTGATMAQDPYTMIRVAAA